MVSRPPTISLFLSFSHLLAQSRFLGVYLGRPYPFYAVVPAILCRTSAASLGLATRLVSSTFAAPTTRLLFLLQLASSTTSAVVGAAVAVAVSAPCVSGATVVPAPAATAVSAEYDNDECRPLKGVGI